MTHTQPDNTRRAAATQKQNSPAHNKNTPDDRAEAMPGDKAARAPAEIGGQTGPDPTRYGDWEKNGRCTDF